MKFDLSPIAALSIAERDRVDAMLSLCPARHLAAAVIVALDARQGDLAASGGAAWTDTECGTALAAAVLLFKAGGGDSARVFKFVLCQLAAVAAERLAGSGGAVLP